MNTYLYAWEGVSCIAVMMIHCLLPGAAGPLMRALARFAVPLFFAVSGKYLMLRWEAACSEVLIADETVTRQTLLRGILKPRSHRTLRILGVVLSVHTLYSLVWHLARDISFREWMRMKYTASAFIRLLFFNTGTVLYDGSVQYDHLWYLCALLYVFLLLYLCGARLLAHAKRIAPFMLLFLYTAQYLQHRLRVVTFGGYASTDFFLLRNWLFFGLAFVISGAALAHVHTGKKGFWLALFGFLITFLEYRHFGARELYLGSLLTVIGALTGEACSGNAGFAATTLAEIGKQCSRHVYYWHLLVYSILIWGIAALPGDLHARPATGWILPGLTYLLTLLVALWMGKGVSSRTQSRSR